ncbi:hypothetical protein AAMO2058_001091200 [Amorphochlora amoebiformis]
MDSKGGKREVFGALLGWTREDCMDFLTESIDLYRKMHELWQGKNVEVNGKILSKAHTIWDVPGVSHKTGLGLGYIEASLLPALQAAAEAKAIETIVQSRNENQKKVIQLQRELEKAKDLGELRERQIEDFKKKILRLENNLKSKQEAKIDIESEPKPVELKLEAGSEPSDSQGYGQIVPTSYSALDDPELGGEEKNRYASLYMDVVEDIVQEEKSRSKFMFEEKDIQIVKILGKGNFATTYLANLKVELDYNEKGIALKVPHPGVSVKEHKKEMFGLMSVAGQKNIMKFLGTMVNSNGIQCFLSELCSLGSLDNLHDDYNLTDEKIFWKIATGLFLGLMHLHHYNIIHRDIACRNILVKSDFQIRIADFGLAVRAPTGVHPATPQEPLPWPWMPPETLKTGLFTPKSDIWAAGVTLWEILRKGMRPYNQMDYKDARAGIVSGSLNLRIPSYVPPKQALLAKACLTYDSKMRPDACECLLGNIPSGFKSIELDGTNEMKTETALTLRKCVPLLPLPTSRGGLAAVAYKGHIYAIGGALDADTDLKSIDVYNIAQGKWKSEGIPNMTEISQKLGGTLCDGKLYIAGGIAGWDDAWTHVEFIDLENPTEWKKLPDLGSNMGMLHLTHAEGYLFACGHTALERLSLSDPSKGWQKIATLKDLPGGMVSIGVDVYVIDRENGVRTTSVPTLTSKGKDTKLTNLKDSKGNNVPAPEVWGGYMATFGAWNGHLVSVGGDTTDIYMLDLAKLEKGWVKSASLISERSEGWAGVAFWEDCMYVMGGMRKGSRVRDFEMLRIGLLKQAMAGAKA